MVDLLKWICSWGLHVEFFHSDDLDRKYQNHSVYFVSDCIQVLHFFRKFPHSQHCFSRWRISNQLISDSDVIEHFWTLNSWTYGHLMIRIGFQKWICRSSNSKIIFYVSVRNLVVCAASDFIPSGNRKISTLAGCNKNNESCL